MKSALYEGTIRHRRHGLLEHELHHRLFMAYLDLDELPGLFDGRWLWSARRPALAWFRRADHLGDPGVPLAESVRDLVAERTGSRPEGPIRLLTNLRYVGHKFNPVSFYYCYDASGEHVVATIADVTNTPWGDRHAYVLPVAHTARHGSVELIEGSLRKELHVSPLLDMQYCYRWRLTVPGERLAVHIEAAPPGAPSVFDATLALSRRELTGGELRRALVRYPFLTVQILAAIYAHALRLRLKGATYFPNPGPRSASRAPSERPPLPT